MAFYLFWSRQSPTLSISPNQEESEKHGILGQTQREGGEDDLKKAKRRQAMYDNIGVVVATLIMVVMALLIILFKVKIM